MLVNGKTAIDAVATLGKGLSILDLVTSGVAPGCHFQIRIGRLIFLKVMSPASWKRTSIRLPMLSVDDRGNANAAGLGQRLEPRGNVYTVAVDVVALNDHITEIDSDPQYDLRLAQDLIRQSVG
jgi:hypothetical protein